MRLALCLGVSWVAALLLGCAGSTSRNTPITISVTPATATVAIGKTQQFTASVMGSSNPAVTWSVAGGATHGTITSTGLYTAPLTVPNPPQVTITATSQADSTKSASATVTVTVAVASGSVSVSPSSATVPDFGTQQFTASVNGSPSTAVTWQVNGVAGGNQTVGFISTSGLYVAPGGVPTKSDGSGGSVTTTVTVSAVSQASSSASGTATVTIQPVNQQAQSGPIEFGTSGGNANDSTTNASTHTITCCGGTLGSLVTRGGTQYILSNTHVLAPRDDRAEIGERIIQPGLVDTSTCTSGGTQTVGTLSDFYSLEMGTGTKIDAAIAAAQPGNVDPGGNILYLGASSDANGVPVPGAPHAGTGIAATVSLPVTKSGRATGLTCSTVLAVSVSTSVHYQKECGSGAKFNVTYSNQVDIAGGAFSAPGDSGSLVVSQANADPVALMYAASDTDTVGNPVSDVLNFFASGGNAVSFVGGDAHQVIGCSLPNKPASASTLAASTIGAEALQKAAALRDAHAPEWMAHPEVQAIGVGASRDNPREPAILFFVTAGQPHNIPPQVDGVRTRIVEGQLFPRRGMLSAEETAQLEQSLPAAPEVYAISAAELARAKVVHAAHVDEQMSQPGVQGVGISSSLDASGQAALMIFLLRGAAHNPIPPLIDGLRTRVRESSRFSAGTGGGARSACTLPENKTPLHKSPNRSN